MHVTRVADRAFSDADVPGIERGRICGSGHGVAVEFCRLKSGAVYWRHPHRHWKQMFVVAGRIDVDGAELQRGDYAFTEPGEWHEVTALEDCILWLSFGQAI